MSRTCRLVTDAMLSAAIPSYFDEWEQDRTAEGWQVHPRLLSPPDATSLRSMLIANQSDHIFLVGDNVPKWFQNDNPDGHYVRPVPYDGCLVNANSTVLTGKLFAAVGRLDFGHQSNILTNFGLNSLDLYRRYFTKRHKWSTEFTWSKYTMHVSMVDNFDTMYPFIGNGFRKSIPPETYQFENSDPYHQTEGYVWDKWVRTRPFIGISSTGGFDSSWLINVGHTVDWVRKDVPVPIHLPFGSFIVNSDGDNALMMGCMANNHTLSTFYSWYGAASFASLFIGATMGDVAKAYQDTTIKMTQLGGDPTMSLPTIYQLTGMVNDLSKKVDLIIAGGVPNPSPPLPPYITGVASPGTMTLTWNPVDGALSYNIKRSQVPGGPYTQVGSSIQTTYIDGNLSSGNYYYVVCSVNAVGEGIISNEITAMVQPSPTQVTFIKQDDVTHGSWKGVYGKDGYQIIGDSTAYPGFVQVSPSNNSYWAWENSTTKPEGLQKASSATDRIGACFYSFSQINVDVTFNDDKTHQMALYVVDWFGTAKRKQTVNILDGKSFATLNAQTVTDFAAGRYYVWNVKGKIRIQINFISSADPQAQTCVCSGLFFDPITT